MPAMKKGVLRIVIALAVTGVLLLLVWQFVAAQFTVMSPRAGRTFLAGDHLLVSRMSYGSRLPFMSSLGHHRIGSGSPARGEWMAFTLPSDTANDVADRPVMIGKCVFLPGDTVRLTPERVLVFGGPHSRRVNAFVVPAKGARVEVTPANARLLCNTINLHEPCHSAVMYGDTLFIDGHAARFITFTQNYYWVYSGDQYTLYDSRRFGFVPETHLIGRVSSILYSIDPEEPFYRMFRKGRFFCSP